MAASRSQPAQVAALPLPRTEPPAPDDGEGQLTVEGERMTTAELAHRYL